MSNVERKYRKQVNKNGWMSKLHRICFGQAAPKFVGYCSFFWFTWFCLLFFPLIMIVRAIATIIAGFVSVFQAIPPMRPPDKVLYSFYDKYLEFGGNDEALNFIRRANFTRFRRVLRWIDVTPDWENCAKQVQYRFLQRKEKSEARAQVNKDRTQKLSKYAGYIAKPILGIIALFLSYQFVKVMIWIVRQFTWPGIVIALEIVGFLLVGASAITVTVIALEHLYNRFRKCPKNPNKIGFWGKIGNAIYNGLEFIAETIETLYTRECPLIEWGDESSPIEKR